MKKNKLVILTSLMAVLCFFVVWGIVSLSEKSDGAEKSSSTEEAWLEDGESELLFEGDFESAASELYEELLKVFSEEGEEKFLEALVLLEFGELNDFGRFIGQVDPLFGIASIEKLDKNEEDYYTFFEALFSGWSSVAPESAIEYLVSLWGQPKGEYDYDLFLLIPTEAWTLKDPFGAVSRFNELVFLTGEESHENAKANFMLGQALSVWSRTYPEDAFSWLRLYGRELLEIEFYIYTVVEGWATVDPLGALEQANIFDEGTPGRTIILDAAITGWAQTDAYSAAEWMDLNIPTADFLLLENAVDQIGVHLFYQISSESALIWIDNIPDEALRETALLDLIFVWSESDKNDINDLLNVFTRKLNEGDPLYESTFPRVVEGLVLSDTELVVQWLREQEDFGPATDYVFEGLVTAIGQSIPVTAYTWVDQIQNEKLKDELRYSLLTSWGYENPESLNLWLDVNRAALPADLLEELLNIVGGS